MPENNRISDLSTELKSCTSKVQRLSNCIEIANLINSELSIDKLLTHIMETTKKAFLADSVSLLLVDEKTGDLTFQIAMGDVGNKIKEIFRLEKGLGIAGSVAQSGIPLNLKDVYEHPNFSPTYDKRTNYRTRAMLCVPLKIHGITLGIIQVMNKLCAPFYFNQEELKMLITIGSSAAVAIDTARMHQTILKKETFNLKEGSCLTIYTDGITEAKNGSGKLFGMERLLQEIQKQPENPDILIRNIAAAVERHALGQGRSDDLTLLSIGVDIGEENRRTQNRRAH